MKRLIAALLSVMAGVCLGQTTGARFDSHVMTSATNVPYGAQAPIYTIPFSTVTICAYPNNGEPCQNTVAIYQDAALTIPQTNPITSDIYGRFGFWVSPGQYSYSIVSPSGKYIGTYVTTIAGGGGGGGGTGPANNLQEIQANKNNTDFQGTGSFTDQLRTLFLQPSVNSPARGICGGRQCAFVNQFGQNLPIQNANGVASGWGQNFYNMRNSLWTGLAYFNGYNTDASQSTEPTGGTATSLQSDTNAFHQMAIQQDIGITTHAGKPYDTANIYSYLACHGGYWGGGDEGCTNIRVNGGNDANREGAILVSGTPTPGATTITYSGALNPDDIMVGGFLIDTQGSSIYTGNITAYDPTQHLLTLSQPAAPLGTGAITVPTSAGTTTNAITVVDADIQASNGVGVSKTVNVHLDSGAVFSPTAVTLLVCQNPTWEFVVPTAFASDGAGNYNLTATFQHGHPAGCYVQQGGTWGIADLQADRIVNVNLNAWRTDYFVYGATDATHIHEAQWLTGARGVINPWRHNFGGGQNHVTNAQVSGNGSSIKLCNLGQSSLNFASSYVKLSGFVPGAYNGLYPTGPMDNNNCTSAPGSATGAITTVGAVDVGGAVNSPDGNTFGPGGFTIWPTARIKQLGTTLTTVNGVQTIAPNNSLLLYPNTMTNVAGHVAVSLDDMQSKVEPLAVFGPVDTSPTQNTNSYFQAISSGYGVTTSSYFGASIVNNNPFTWYKGGGTCNIPNGFCLDGAIGLNVGGPWAFGMRIQQPLAGGTVLEAYPSPMAVANQGDNTHFFLRDDGPGGNIGFYVAYNPNTGNTTIASGIGTGVVSAINMTLTSLSFSASASTSFFSPSFLVQALQGTGTRVVTADPTGTLGTVTGFSGTKTGAACVFTVTNGIITNITGC